MRAFRGLLLFCLCALSACAPKHRLASGPPVRTPLARIASADRLVREGCLDCLLDAFNQYDELSSSALVGESARKGAIETAILIAMRERELGLLDAPFLSRARELARSSGSFDTIYVRLLDIVESMATRWAVVRGSVGDDPSLAAIQKAYRNRDAWLALLEPRADQDALSAYLWIAFNCTVPTNGIKAGDVPRWMSATRAWADSALLKYRAATCGSYDRPVLDALLVGNPRFVELDYFLAFTATQATRTGNLDDAAALFQKAYEWRPRWPAVTLQIAGVYLTAEEYDKSHEFYERTLAMSPTFPDALLGNVRALTYAGRHDEALAAVDRLLALEHWHIGDARYWRALNEAELARYDEAWDDVELAAKLNYNAEVPKLAGIIAYRRHQLDVSRGKFEESRTRDPADCEVGFYLQIVEAEQGQWSPVADVAPASAICFDHQETELRNQIADIRAKPMAPEKQARQITRREQTIGSNARMRAICWFNAAVASFNLKKPDDVRKYGEKVAADEQFGDRIRDLFSRLRQER
jgi:tetratricopeptide (TPR) repeat protein